MAYYSLSFCYTKTGKTFEVVSKHACAAEILTDLIQIYGYASTEPSSITMETIHDGKCIRKVHHLNKVYNGKPVFKIKVEKKDED